MERQREIAGEVFNLGVLEQLRGDLRWGKASSK
jgi:hypothetical protein